MYEPLLAQPEELQNRLSKVGEFLKQIQYIFSSKVVKWYLFSFTLESVQLAGLLGTYYELVNLRLYGQQAKPLLNLSLDIPIPLISMPGSSSGCPLSDPASYPCMPQGEADNASSIWVPATPRSDTNYVQGLLSFSSAKPTSDCCGHSGVNQQIKACSLLLYPSLFLAFSNKTKIEAQM